MILDHNLFFVDDRYLFISSILYRDVPKNLWTTLGILLSYLSGICPKYQFNVFHELLHIFFRFLSKLQRLMENKIGVQDEKPFSFPLTLSCESRKLLTKLLLIAKQVVTGFGNIQFIVTKFYRFLRCKPRFISEQTKIWL